MQHLFVKFSTRCLEMLAYSEDDELDLTTFKIFIQHYWKNVEQIQAQIFT